jgi:multimeric flavodoxin WrbA
VAKVAVVFHSAGGTTESLADSVISGVASLPGVDALRVEILGSDIVEGRYKNQEVLDSLDCVDAIIFGSPTYMGSASAQFKAFADATGDKWSEKIWTDKIAGGFTIGSNLSGDQLMTTQYFQIFANQHGMIWASLDIPGGCDPEGRNRLGAQSGLIAQSTDNALNEIDLVTAKYLGMRIAKLAIRHSISEE